MNHANVCHRNHFRQFLLAVGLALFTWLQTELVAYSQTKIEPPIEILFRAYSVKDWNSQIPFELPRMIEGFPGTARVRVHNSTNETWTDLHLELSDSEISIAEFASKDVPPGSSFDFELTIQSPKVHRLKKKVEIFSGPADKDTKKLLASFDVTGSVLPAAWVSPDSFTLRDFADGKARVLIRSADQKKVRLIWDEIQFATPDVSLKFDKDLKLEGILQHSIKLLPSKAAILEGKEDVTLELQIPFFMVGKSEKFTCKTEIKLLAEKPVRVSPNSIEINPERNLGTSQPKAIEFAITDQRDLDTTSRPITVRFAKRDAGGVYQEFPLSDVKIVNKTDRFRLGTVSIPAELVSGKESASRRLIILEESSPSQLEPIGEISLLIKPE